MNTLRFLHTSDWHLGRSFAGVDRSTDFASFLTWLLGVIDAKNIDVLLVAGDIFDTTMPSTEAQRLYYDFLRRLANTHLKACVITAGNHDSQRFLSAPKGLLQAFRVYIAGDEIKDEAIVLKDDEGIPYAGIAAVPWLREGMLFRTAENLSDPDRSQRWKSGIQSRYQAVRKELEDLLGPKKVPMVAMGHLFVTNQDTPNSDVYVGSLRNVPSSVFGSWDYIALGHIHTPMQLKDTSVPTYYCGSPLRLDFGDKSIKQVIVGEFDGTKLASIEKLAVPQPRDLLRIESDTIEGLTENIQVTAQNHLEAIVECVLTGSCIHRQELLDAVETAIKGTSLHVAAIRLVLPEKTHSEGTAEQDQKTAKDPANKEAIFQALLDEKKVPEADKPLLLSTLKDVFADVTVNRQQEESPTA